MYRFMRFEFTGSGIEKLYEQLLEGTASAREHDFDIEILYNNRQSIEKTQEIRGLLGIRRQTKIRGEQVELVLGADEEAFEYYSAQLHAQGIFPKNDFTVRNTTYNFTSQSYKCEDKDSVPGHVHSAKWVLRSRPDLRIEQTILLSTKTEDVPGKKTVKNKKWVYIPDPVGNYTINIPRGAGEPEYILLNGIHSSISSRQETYRREVRDIPEEVQIVIPTTVYYKALDARISGDVRDVIGLKNEIERVIQVGNSFLIFNP